MTTNENIQPGTPITVRLSNGEQFDANMGRSGVQFRGPAFIEFTDSTVPGPTGSTTRVQRRSNIESIDPR